MNFIERKIRRPNLVVMLMATLILGCQPGVTTTMIEAPVVTRNTAPEASGKGARSTKAAGHGRFSILRRNKMDFGLSGTDYATTNGMNLEVGMGNSMWGYGFAGIEISGASIMNVRLEAPSVYKHYDENAFAGFLIDYHTGAGYSKRIMLGVGLLDPSRWDNGVPAWGDARKPRQFIDLGRRSVYFLDLNDWAPPGWDGRAWFNLGIENAGHNNSLGARLFVR